MKRLRGGEPRASKPSVVGRSVAGLVPCAPKVHGVSPASALPACVDVAGRDAARVDDFVEFLLGEAAEERAPSLPDPVFRDRLRRRLWRLHAVTLSSLGRDLH